MKTQQRPLSIARERFHELEALLVELVDEVDYWKSTCDALTAEVEALRSEKEQLIAEQRVAESWRLGLAEELADYAREDPWLFSVKSTSEDRSPSRNPIRGVVLGVPLALLLWGVVILVALLAFWLSTS